MNDQATKAALRAAIIEAIETVGFDVFKQTSMFPLSRRQAARVEQKQAA